MTELRTAEKQTLLPQLYKKNLYYKNLDNYFFQVSGKLSVFSDSCTFACFFYLDCKVLEQPVAAAFA